MSRRRLIVVATAWASGLALAGCGDRVAAKAAETASAALASTPEPHLSDVAAPAMPTPSPATPLYCLDDTGVYQPFVRTSLGRLAAGFERQFGWTLSTAPGGEIEGGHPFSWLLFSASDTPTSADEMIAYAVEPHEDGLALLKMIATFEGMEPDVKGGTEMCGHTLVIVNLPPPE